MTREEALQILDTIPTIGEQVDALEMAIQALEQNESAEEWYKLFVKKLDEQEPCDDAEQKERELPCIYDLKNRYCPRLNEHGMLKYPLQEPTEKPMCDRNICISNEYNGIGCDECIVNKAEQESKSPCDVCMYNPPSSTDGKPCTMCPATGK